MVYITSTELRNWTGLTSADKPTNTVIEFLITQGEVILAAEVDSADDDMMKVCSLMLCGSLLLKWLASNCVKDGYYTFSLGGEISVSKSYKELMELSEMWEKKYQDITGLMVNADVTYTQFLASAGLDSTSIQDIKDIYQSVGNMWDFEVKYKPGITSRRTSDY